MKDNSVSSVPLCFYFLRRPFLQIHFFALRARISTTSKGDSKKPLLVDEATNPCGDTEI